METFKVKDIFLDFLSLKIRYFSYWKNFEFFSIKFNGFLLVNIQTPIKDLESISPVWQFEKLSHQTNR